MIRCRECGHVVKCPKCNLSLTLYKEKGYAKCNYCDYKLYNYDECSCGSRDFINLGFGEERINEELKKIVSKIKKETQFNKKMQLNLEANNIKQEIERLQNIIKNV